MAPTDPDSGRNNGSNSWQGVLIALIGTIGTVAGIYISHKPVPATVIVQPQPVPKPQPQVPQRPQAQQGHATQADKPPRPPLQAKLPIQPETQPQPAPQPLPQRTAQGTTPPITPQTVTTQPPQTYPTLVLQQLDADHDGFMGHTQWRFLVFVNGIQAASIPQLEFHHLPHHGTVNAPGWVSWNNPHIKTEAPYNIVVHAYRPNEDVPKGESGYGTIQALGGAATVHIKGGGPAAPYDFTLTFTIVGAP